ncbi:MAG: hypothetical protein EAZ55_03880 [Cytophagales bacterium]|nr:MAG: hypothetical protein EAZ55_03880 [Cytophagales bacterium]
MLRATESEKEIPLPSYNTLHLDSLSAGKEITNTLLFLQKKGYWEAQIERIFWVSDTMKVFIEAKKMYRWAHLDVSQIPMTALSMMGYREKDFRGAPIDWEGLQLLEERLLEYAENRGYPFANVFVDSILIKEEGLVARLRFEPNDRIVFDSIAIAGNNKIKARFLSKYLQIISDAPFNQSLIDRSSLLLNRLPYLRVQAVPKVFFQLGRAYTTLYIGERKASQIDGILGILPNQERPDEVLFTGEFNLHLQNILGVGIGLTVEWQRIQSESQRLLIGYKQPQLFGTKVALEGYFSLLRQDSTFLTLDRGIVLSYRLSAFQELGLSFSARSSNNSLLLNNIQQQRETPIVSDQELWVYGLRYEYNRLNDFWYATKGYRLQLMAELGDKSTPRNPFLADSLWVGISEKSLQFGAKLNGEYFIPMGKKNTWLWRMQWAYVDNNNILFMNDLYRLGGLMQLRGHNQNEFYANFYGLLSSEYRIFLEAESYFFLFFDYSYYQMNVLRRASYEDTPFGLGLGISLSTEGGIFNFVYALGQSAQNSLDFSRSKIHFGFIGRF